MLPSYMPCLVAKKSKISGAEELSTFEVKLTEPQREEWLRSYLLFDLKNHLNIVPIKTDDCYARYANDLSPQGRVCLLPFGTKKRRSVKMCSLLLPYYLPCVRPPCASELFLTSSPGEEIFVDYGSNLLRAIAPNVIPAA
jgi:hypothetical protein